MADLQLVQEFATISDLHAQFVSKVTSALTEVALEVRQNPANPMDAENSALQRWAVRVLPDPRAEALRMLPTLAVMANNAGRINEDGSVDASDELIKTTVTALAPIFSGYIAEVV